MDYKLSGSCQIIEQNIIEINIYDLVIELRGIDINIQFSSSTVSSNRLSILILKIIAIMTVRIQYISAVPLRSGLKIIRPWNISILRSCTCCWFLSDTIDQTVNIRISIWINSLDQWSITIKGVEHDVSICCTTFGGYSRIKSRTENFFRSFKIDRFDLVVTPSELAITLQCSNNEQSGRRYIVDIIIVTVSLIIFIWKQLSSKIRLHMHFLINCRSNNTIIDSTTQNRGIVDLACWIVQLRGVS